MLDLNMPGMNGREALKEMKSDHGLRGIPVVVLTTSDEPDDVRFCYDTGVNTYMLKPVDYDGWFEAMKALSACWFEWMVLPPSDA